MVFDVDSTLIEDEAIELLAERCGKRAEVAAITARAMRGELDFAESLIERVATLSGLGEEVLKQVAAELTPTKGAAELVTAIHDRGGVAAAVSGGFIQLLGPVKGQIVDREIKAQALKQWAEELKVPLSRTIAVGDGANDLGMMAVAGLSVAFCAKPVVRENAKIALNERDLAVLIPLLP